MNFPFLQMILNQIIPVSLSLKIRCASNPVESNHSPWQIVIFKSPQFAYFFNVYRMFYLMKDEEMQATFKGHYKQFDISLRMSSENVLSIVVENTQTLEKSSQKIDREYILQQDNFFQSVFEGAHEVYDCLKASINQIVFEGELLSFDYEYGINKKVRRISIQLLKEGAKGIELQPLNAQKIKEHFTAQLLQRDIEIKLMKRKYDGLVQTLQQLREDLEIEKCKNRDLSDNVDRLLPLILVVQDLKNIIKDSFSEVKMVSRIHHHPNNSHKFYFILTNLTNSSARIIRKGENGNYNFVNKCEILPNQKVKYSLTILKTTGSNIMVGFCTQKGLGNSSNYKHAESAYYYCWKTGYLWQGGYGKQLNVGSVEGETMECVADLTNFRFSWWKKGNKIAECNVPVQMRNKQIYISIILYYSGDVVDLCI